jgi:ATPase subunit of ABC transporter with duplicated ATPase domains
MITVSHDRAFLDEVCTDCLHLSGVAKRVTQEKGNYSIWMKRRINKKKAFDQKVRASQPPLPCSQISMHGDLFLNRNRNSMHWYF